MSTSVHLHVVPRSGPSIRKATPHCERCGRAHARRYITKDGQAFRCFCSTFFAINVYMPESVKAARMGSTPIQVLANHTVCLVKQCTLCAERFY
jgi:hypothetical protein